MRIAFTIHTPGQANFWHYPIRMLKDRGHDIGIVARDDGLTCELLQRTGIKIDVYGKAGGSGRSKLAQIPQQLFSCLNIMRQFKPDVILGTGILEGYSAFLLTRPLIIFEDSETTFFWGLERAQWKRLAHVILTPDNFTLDFGRKHVRFRGYKEIAYLHPNFFTPDPAILDKLGVKAGDKYVVVRLNSFDAVHDIGKHGFSVADQFEIVRQLEQYARVFISPEGRLPEELQKYVLPIPKDRIHHALYYAQLLVSDTQTMTTEAAVLGTPAVRSNNWVGPDDMSNFVELEKKYDLIYSFQSSEMAIRKAVDLIRLPNLKELWAVKRQRLLGDKSDVSRFIADFIEHYPRSLKEYRDGKG